MTKIYVIKNDINNKQYVGKTNFSLEERFLKEHCHDYKLPREKKRPLYDAMNKYGIDHFWIELLEECNESEWQEREKYWIDKLDTYKNGYNATIGGDGQQLYDHEQIWNIYLENKNIQQTARIIGCDRRIVRRVINNHGVYNPPTKSACPVVQLDCDNELYIAEYESCSEASRAIKGDIHGRGGINTACLDANKTAYGYKWRYAEDFYNNIIPPRKTPRGRRVSQIDLQTGNILAIYQNANVAAKRLDHPTSGCKILEVIAGKRKTAFGYKWVYTDM